MGMIGALYERGRCTSRQETPRARRPWDPTLQKTKGAAPATPRKAHQLKSACPWLKVKLNQPVPISHKMLGCYTEACIQYLLARLYDVMTCQENYATIRQDFLIV